MHLGALAALGLAWLCPWLLFFSGLLLSPAEILWKIFKAWVFTLFTANLLCDLASYFISLDLHCLIFGLGK